MRKIVSWAQGGDVVRVEYATRLVFLLPFAFPPSSLLENITTMVTLRISCHTALNSSCRDHLDDFALVWCPL